MNPEGAFRHVFDVLLHRSLGETKEYNETFCPDSQSHLPLTSLPLCRYTAQLGQLNSGKADFRRNVRNLNLDWCRLC
jgi:hypothetical protein